MVSEKIIIEEKNGLHMRPAKALCQVAADYKCRISLVSDNINANAKSLLNVLGAGIKYGANIEVICDGEDEREALEAVIKVLSELKDI